MMGSRLVMNASRVVLHARRAMSVDMGSIKVAVLGAGNMAEAMVDGMVDKGALGDGNLAVFDINHHRLQLFQKKYGARVANSLPEAVEGADVVVLSVKPQNVARVGMELKGHLQKGVVLSIVAGLPLTSLEEHLGTARVVRSMPNTPARVKEGITVWSCGPGTLSQREKDYCAELLSAFGEEVFVEDEAFLDMATAVSGSGPAYIFLLMESMIETAVHFGMPRHIATKLVQQTIRGSASYAIAAAEKNPAELRAEITSPGGTTASAMYTLEAGSLRTTVADGLWSAYRRSLELGGQDSNVGPGRQRPVRPPRDLGE